MSALSTKRRGAPADASTATAPVEELFEELFEPLFEELFEPLFEELFEPLFEEAGSEEAREEGEAFVEVRLMDSAALSAVG